MPICGRVDIVGGRFDRPVWTDGWKEITMDDPVGAVVEAFRHLKEPDQARAYHEIDKLWKLKARNDRRDHHEDQSASECAGK
jgi:hypothetical protein